MLLSCWNFNYNNTGDENKEKKFTFLILVSIWCPYYLIISNAGLTVPREMYRTCKRQTKKPQSYICDGGRGLFWLYAQVVRLQELIICLSNISSNVIASKHLKASTECHFSSKCTPHVHYKQHRCPSGKAEGQSEWFQFYTYGPFNCIDDSGSSSEQRCGS